MISPEEILADPLYTRFTGRSTASGLNDVGPAGGGLGGGGRIHCLQMALAGRWERSGEADLQAPSSWRSWSGWAWAGEHVWEGD